MGKTSSFQDYAIVACGTLSEELNHLKDAGLIDARKILFTEPGGHQVPLDLENQLIRQIKTAKTYAPHIIVVYGGAFCYVNTENPRRTIDTVIQEQAEPDFTITRIKATHCVDMLASEEERSRISGGKDVYYLTPGWVKYRDLVYRGWDQAVANENFPRHTGGAVILDATGYYERIANSNAEQLLDFSDWMGLPLEPQPVTLNRFLGLLYTEVKEEKHD